MKLTIRPLGPMTGMGRPYVAIDENGVMVACHYCSTDEFAMGDLGPNRPSYKRMYPEGVEVSFDPTIVFGGEPPDGYSEDAV